jgi:transmembrane sensor
MSNESRYRFLLEKYLREECTSSEVKELFGLLRERGADRIVLNNMQEAFKQAFKTEEPIPEEISDRIWAKLKTDMEPVPVVPVRSSFKKWLKVAAAVIVVTLSVYLYKQYNYHEAALQPVVNKTRPVNTDITPGGNKALLTLADGKQIVLENAKSGLLARQGNMDVNKQEDALIYNVSQKTGPSPLATDHSLLTTPVYNTISIPRGGHYRVVLPDGSKVWLNASSSLRFPMVFSGVERNVELWGEAYFEVEKDKNRPFIVTAINDHRSNGVGRNNMRIEVLGTHFNVMAYDDEPDMRVTLLEGKVNVSRTDSRLTTIDSRLLLPGQQALLNKDDKLSVSAGDTEGAVAWKNGYFKFSHENIRSVMNKISRWYDVDIAYKGKVPEKALWGTVSRFENVSDVLDMLASTGIIHFQLEGRKIIVME